MNNLFVNINQFSMKLTPWFILVNLLLFLVLIYLNRAYIKSIFKKIGWKSWFFLFLILVFAFYIRLFLIGHYYHLWTDEAVHIETGKNLLQNFSQGNYSRSIGWPFLLSIIFRFFGLNVLVALYASSILGALTVINIFLLTFVMTKNRSASLISALVFSMFFSHVNWSGSASTVVPSLYFVTLTLFFCFLYYKNRSNSLLWLSLISLAFTSLFRPENYIFPVLFLFGCIIFDVKFFERIKFKKYNFGYYSPWLILILISLPNLFSVLLYTTNSLEAEIIREGGILFSLFGFFGFIKFVFISFLSSGIFYQLSIIIITIFSIIGIYHLITSHRREFYFLSAWFFFAYFFIGFFFEAHLLTGTVERAYLNFFPVISIFIAYGIMFIIFKLKKTIKPNLFILIFLIITSILFLALPFPKIWSHGSGIARTLDVKMPSLVERDVHDGCVILANRP